MNEKIRVNIILITNLILIIITLLVLFYIQIRRKGEYEELSKENRVRKITHIAPRGIIYDNKSNILAENVKSYSVFIIPELFEQTYDNLLQLSDLLNIDIDSLKGLFVYNNKEFICIKNNVDIEKAIFIQEHSEQFRGIIVLDRFFRFYPFKRIFTHIVGYVGEIDSLNYEMNKQLGYSKNDFEGKMGIEKFYEKQLKGKNGVSYYEIDNNGRIIRELEKQISKKSKIGYSLYTSLSVKLQLFLDSISREYESIGICVMNSKTGRVLALLSKPTFNPNLFIYGIKADIYNFLRRNVYAPLENRVVEKIYPIGSIVYPFISLLKLNIFKDDSLNNLQPCIGKILLGDRELYCWKNHGKLNFEQAFLQSCDIYFYQLGAMIGFNRIASEIIKNNLIQKTFIDISDEEKSYLYENNSNKDIENELLKGALLASGKDYFNMTLIKMLVFINAFNNNGNMITPVIVDSVKDDNRIIVRNNTKIESKLKFPLESIEYIKRILYDCVNTEGANASAARMKDVEVYGITSLFQNHFNRENAVFVGFTNTSKNQDIAIIVFIDNVENGKYESALLSKKIIKFIYGNSDEIF